MAKGMLPPRDPEDVIVARMESQPVDEFTVLVKDQGGVIMQYFFDNGGSFEPYKGVLSDKDALKNLKFTGGKFAYEWLRADDVRYNGTWVPVKLDVDDKDGNPVASSECYAPFARGEQTDGFIHHRDVVLCHSPLERARKIVQGIALRSDTKRIIAEQKKAAKADMMAAGAVSADASFELTEDQETGTAGKG